MEPESPKTIPHSPRCSFLPTDITTLPEGECVCGGGGGAGRGGNLIQGVFPRAYFDAFGDFSITELLQHYSIPVPSLVCYLLILAESL